MLKEIKYGSLFKFQIMKKLLVYLILSNLSLVVTFAQRSFITLDFTARANGLRVPVDSIRVENLTMGCDTLLISPDTSLLLQYATGITDGLKDSDEALRLVVTGPNPFGEHTTITLFLAAPQNVFITISNQFGRNEIIEELCLGAGYHAFTFIPGKKGLFFLTARSNRCSRTVKLMTTGCRNNHGIVGALEYKGQSDEQGSEKSGRVSGRFMFSPGNKLRYTAFTAFGGRMHTDSPTNSRTYLFQYANPGIPCPGIPEISDADGNIYRTVLIGNQCWMAGNLKTTTYQSGLPIPNVMDAGAWQSLEDGAYVLNGNNPDWIDKYGALYNWFAVMDANGLCPSGWHVPANDEWRILTDFLGGISSANANQLKSCRQYSSPLGFDCNTFEHPYWEEDTFFGNYGTDDFGFSAFPGGSRYNNGEWNYPGAYGFWWSASDQSASNAWSYIMYSESDKITMNTYYKRRGHSVRCIKTDYNIGAGKGDGGNMYPVSGVR